jgi:nucleoside 2-deoxyribosyltransferase
MKKAYLAISYSNRKKFDKEVDSLKEFFFNKEIDLLVFVDNYNFKPNQEQLMMQTAFKEIDSCDLLIAELTTKSIGVGIEIGYAFAKQIPIIYLHKENAEYSTTASGSANHSIMYHNETDLIKKLGKLY